MNKNVIDYANSKKAELKDRQRRDRRMYSILTISISVINLVIVVMAAIALDILIREGGDSNSLNIVMASIAAALTIAIFVVNIFVVIFRGFARFNAYKAGMDEIQREVMAYSLKEKSYALDGSDETLDKNVNEIFERTMKRKEKVSMTKMIIKALVGGDND